MCTTFLLAQNGIELVRNRRVHSAHGAFFRGNFEISFQPVYLSFERTQEKKGKQKNEKKQKQKHYYLFTIV